MARLQLFNVLHGRERLGPAGDLANTAMLLQQQVERLNIYRGRNHCRNVGVGCFRDRRDCSGTAPIRRFETVRFWAPLSDSGMVECGHSTEQAGKVVKALSSYNPTADVIFRIGEREPCKTVVADYSPETFIHIDDAVRRCFVDGHQGVTAENIHRKIRRLTDRVEWQKLDQAHTNVGERFPYPQGYDRCA